MTSVHVAGVAAGAVGLAAVLAVAGCAAGQTQGASPSAFDTPTAAAVSWFAAVNRKDRAAALAHFTPGSTRTGDWGTGPATWPTFASVECKDETEGAGDATGDARVHCDFRESGAPSAGQPSSWWDVYLRRQPDGRWLIYAYGQG